MLRVDKVTLSLLAEDVKSMLMGDFGKIPTLKMLFEDTDTLKKNAEILFDKIKEIASCKIIDTSTPIGGGSTPNRKIPSVAVTIKVKNYSPHKIQTLFRKQNIIGRIEDEKFLLDFRTIDMNDIIYISESIQALVKST